MLLRILFGCKPSSVYFFYFVAVSALLLFISGIKAEDPTTSDTDLSSPRTLSDSTALESTVKHRKVRNNAIRYGSIYKGNNSSIRGTRPFTRRPKVSRRDRHRHSTKVDTTKIPVVLLPPVLTFKNLDRDEKREPFVINVVSPKQPTVLPESSTKPFTPAYDDQLDTSQSTLSSKKPYMDEKIMAMKNFGIRMKGRSRGEVKFHGSPTDRSSTTGLNDYTPPPTVFPTEQKSRQVSRQTSRRRSRVRTTTALPTTAATTPQILPRENQFDYGTYPSQTQETPTSDLEADRGKLNFENLIYQEGSTPAPISDFTNASLNDVLNYDIQRTSPRTIFSLDATGPVRNHSPSPVDANDNQEHGNRKAVVSSPSPTEHRTVTISTPDVTDFGGITVSSPGTPTTHVDDFFSNVPQVSSSFVPRTEINVATSTSQFTDSSTPSSGEDYDFKDVIYPPLDVLSPPYLEDEFHDSDGNIISNVTESQNYNAERQFEFVSTSYPDSAKSSFAELVDNGISQPEDSNNSVQNPTESHQVFLVGDQTRTDGNKQQDVSGRQPNSNQFADCENGDCLKNETIPQPWSNFPLSPSDIKVLSNEDGIELINKMYENLLRVLNGGPDYYDLSEDPQPIQQFQAQTQLQYEPQKQQEQQKEHQQQQQYQDQVQETKEIKTQDNSLYTSSESSLSLAESGDIRNSLGRHQNEIVPSGRRSSRRKDVQDSPENVRLKQARADRNASRLCTSKTLSYVADVSTGCKVFYVCTEYGVGEPMLCPNGTLFNQDYLVCDWWYNVDCS